MSKAKSKKTAPQVIDVAQPAQEVIDKQEPTDYQKLKVQLADIEMELLRVLTAFERVKEAHTRLTEQKLQIVRRLEKETNHASSESVQQ